MNRRFLSSSVSHVVVASVFLLTSLMPPAALTAQTSSTFEGAPCTVPPAPPDRDPWPVAVTDSLGSTTSPLSVSFSGASLLSNDRGTTAVSLVRVASNSSNGGAITGSDPYVYTPAALFTGIDIFTYVIRDESGEKTTGVVTIVVNADVTPPAVDLTAPAAGTVSGIVTVTAAAADNVGVAGVKFFDGSTQIGAEGLRAPFSASWDSRLVTDGTHTLTAIARDAAGNLTTSAAIVVNVVNSPSR